MRPSVLTDGRIFSVHADDIMSLRTSPQTGVAISFLSEADGVKLRQGISADRFAQGMYKSLSPYSIMLKKPTKGVI